MLWAVFSLLLISSVYTQVSYRQFYLVEWCISSVVSWAQILLSFLWSSSNMITCSSSWMEASIWTRLMRWEYVWRIWFYGWFLLGWVDFADEGHPFERRGCCFYFHSWGRWLGEGNGGERDKDIYHCLVLSWLLVWPCGWVCRGMEFLFSTPLRVIWETWSNSWSARGLTWTERTRWENHTDNNMLLFYIVWAYTPFTGYAPWEW